MYQENKKKSSRKPKKKKPRFVDQRQPGKGTKAAVHTIAAAGIRTQQAGNSGLPKNKTENVCENPPHIPPQGSVNSFHTACSSNNITNPAKKSCMWGHEIMSFPSLSSHSLPSHSSQLRGHACTSFLYTVSLFDNSHFLPLNVIADFPVSRPSHLHSLPQGAEHHRHSSC